MWYATSEKSVEKYRRYHLEQLIAKGDTQITSSVENRLYFLLCLADTIEPLKRFKDLRWENVLANIEIGKVKSGFKIRVLNDNFIAYLNSLKSLEDWMRVAVTQGTDCREIEITVL